MVLLPTRISDLVWKIYKSEEVAETEEKSVPALLVEHM